MWGCSLVSVVEPQGGGVGMDALGADFDDDELNVACVNGHQWRRGE